MQKIKSIKKHDKILQNIKKQSCFKYLIRRCKVFFLFTPENKFIEYKQRFYYLLTLKMLNKIFWGNKNKK